MPIQLNVRGICCLRAGVAGLSENIRVFSTLGRFLEHGRIYRFENKGDSEFFIGSADWMQRNLNRRMETIAPVADPVLKQELEQILQVYEKRQFFGLGHAARRQLRAAGPPESRTGNDRGQCMAALIFGPGHFKTGCIRYKTTDKNGRSLIDRPFGFIGSCYPVLRRDATSSLIFLTWPRPRPLTSQPNSK